MWPFGEKVAGRLSAALGARDPVKVSVLTTVVSPDTIMSPISGVRAAVIDIEILERIPASSNDSRESDTDVYELLGTFVFGDLVTLRDEGGDEISIVVGRARIDPQLPRHGGHPLSRVPPEVVPLLARASGRGVVCYRELTLEDGDKVRLKATIEPSHTVVSSGYRSGTKSSYVARDDLAPVVLEEVFDSPPG